MSKKTKGTHAINRTKICLLCHQKPKNTFKLTDILKDRLEILFPEYNSLDIRLPCVLCDGCRRASLRATKNSENQSESNLLFLDKSVFLSFEGNIDLDDKECQCGLCIFVKSRAVHLSQKRKIEDKKIKNNRISKKRKLCPLCLGKIARGIRHDCKKSNVIKNLMENVEDFRLKNKHQIVSAMLKLDANAQSKDAEMSLSQRHGKPLKIIVRPTEKQQISAQHMCDIQTNLNLSQRQTKALAHEIRSATGNKFIIEPNLESLMFEKSHIMKDHFEIVQLNFITTSKGVAGSSKLAVICKDLEKFIDFIIKHRKIQDYHLKFGIDGGGQFLKVCLSIQSTATSELLGCGNRSKREFKDSSVKKLFIIGLTSAVQENHHNVSILWDKLKINKFLSFGTVATDLKLANVLIGIMSHASTFPCTWCEAKKGNLGVIGTSRKLTSCRKNYEEWVTSSKTKKKIEASCFKNCCNAPILSACNDDILDIIPPPELHLLLGCVNLLYRHMLLEFEFITKKWTKLCNVERKNMYFGKFGFTGNPCKILLEKVDILREISSTHDITCMKYVDAFEKFHKVVKSCFSLTLDTNFGTHIHDFRESFEALNIPISPKMHAIFFHIKPFCDKHGLGLGFYSEQAFESVHYDFCQMWTKFKVNQGNEHYGAKLLRAVSYYNSTHL